MSREQEPLRPGDASAGVVEVDGIALDADEALAGQHSRDTGRSASHERVDDGRAPYRLTKVAGRPDRLRRRNGVGDVVVLECAQVDDMPVSGQLMLELRSAAQEDHGIQSAVVARCPMRGIALATRHDSVARREVTVPVLRAQGATAWADLPSGSHGTSSTCPRPASCTSCRSWLRGNGAQMRD